MKQPNGWPGLVLLTALMLAGCAHDGPAAVDETVQSRIVLTLGTPHAAALDGAIRQCTSIITSVVLSIDGRPLPSQSAELGDQVTFFVEVNVGLRTFAVEIFSENGTRLFADSTRQMIERDGFVVGLTAMPVNPVMQVCTYDEIKDKFDIGNRGSGVLVWNTLPPPELCGAGPCVKFVPEGGSVRSGGVVTVMIITNTDEVGRVFVAAVTSAEGTILLEVEISPAAARQGRHAARATLRPTDAR